MLKTGEKIRRLLSVFVTWVVLVMIFLSYEKYFVNREAEFLKARAFQSLATISEELNSQVHRAQLLTESYAQLAVLQHQDPHSNADPVGFLRLYFGEINQNHILEPSVKLASRCVNIKGRVPLQSDVSEFDLNSLVLSLSCFARTVAGEPDSPDPKSKTFLYSLDLSVWIRNAFQPLGGDFDDVLLADSSGQVLFNKSPIAPRIANFKSVLLDDEPKSQEIGLSKPGNRQEGTTETPTSNIDSDASGKGIKSLPKSSFTSLTRNTALTQITVAGEQYELFSQPTSITLTGPLPGRTWRLVLCGTWRGSRFESESRAIPYSTLIWAALISLAFFSLSWPVFKLRYMSNTERFTATEGWYLVLTLFLASTSATIMLLNASYTSRSRNVADDKLKELASRINVSYQDEMSVAYKQLQHFQPNPYGKLLIPNYLQTNKEEADIYPYFEIAFWANGDGDQIQKVDVRPAATPNVNVRDLPFFKRIASDLDSKGGSGDAAGNDTKSRTNSWPQSFDSIYLYPQMSLTTNEFVAGLSGPFLRPNLQKPARVATLMMRPISLVDPVLPPGYGFAVIDEECRVQFHSESFKNLRENFCRESKQPKELQPWLFGGRDTVVDITYMGTPEHAFITSLPPPQFAAGHAFLIVFEESDHRLTSNLAIVLVCAILLGAYFVFLLFAAFAHISLRGPLHKIYVPRLIWPCAENSSAYLQIAAAIGAILVLFWMSYLELYEAPLLTLTILVAALAPILVILKLKCQVRALLLFGRVLIYISAAVLMALAGFLFVKSEALGAWWRVLVALGFSGMIAILLSGTLSRNLKISPQFAQASASLYLFARNHFGLAYTIASVAVITAMFVVPCIGCFKYAYDAVTELSLKHDEITLSERLSTRKNRVVDYYQTVKVQSPWAEITKRLALPWDRYDNCSFAVERTNNTDDYFAENVPPAFVDHPCGTDRNQQQGPSSPQTEKLNLAIERLIAKATLSFPSNRLGSEISKVGVASSEQPSDNWEHFFTELADINFKLTWKTGSRLPDMTVLAGFPKWRGMTWWCALGIPGLWIVLALWVMSLVRKIFFTEVPSTRSFDEVDWKDVKEITSNFLVLGQAKSGKTAWLNSISGLAPSNSLDLRINPKQTIKRYFLSQPPGGAPVIALDHFDFNLKDRDFNLDKLQLLEKLLYQRGHNVVVVSTVEPLYFLGEGSREWLSDGKDPDLVRRLLDRWARVLSMLKVVRPRKLYDGRFNRKIEEFIQHRKMGKLARQFAFWVRQECRSTAMLRAIGAEILENQTKSDPVTHEWVVSNVLDRAEDYYHLLWSGLSAGERLVLYQLALDGWANPKNIAALQQLERKSLIRRAPSYRLMNESFREFVLGTEHFDEIEEWEKHEKQSTWRAAKLVLILLAVGAGAWLLHSQAALSHVLVAYIAGIGTLLTAIAGLLGRSSVKSSAKPQ